MRSKWKIILVVYFRCYCCCHPHTQKPSYLNTHRDRRCLLLQFLFSVYMDVLLPLTSLVLFVDSISLRLFNTCFSADAYFNWAFHSVDGPIDGKLNEFNWIVIISNKKKPFDIIEKHKWMNEPLNNFIFSDHLFISQRWFNVP